MGRNKKNVPKRRFKEFENSEAWEKRKLATIAEFNPKAELPETFEYVDLESVVGTEMIAHREERKVTAPSRAQRLARQGDLFYQTVRPYQKNNYLFEKSCNNYVFSTGYAQMRPHGDGYFLLTLVQNNGFVKSVLDRCTGTSYPAINSNDLAEMEVYIPVKNNEQVKIGNYFKSLDTLITLHQHKLDKTKALKKAYLTEMFPAEGERKPKLRFAGYANDWEQRKLGEYLKLITYGFTNPMPDTDNGPWKITAKDIVDGQINYNMARHTEIQAYENLLTSKSKPVLEDVLLTKDGTLGRSAIVRENGVCINQSVALLRCNQDILCPSFLNVLLSSKRYQTKMLDDAGGGTIKHIYISKVEKMVIEIPDIDEQKQISVYFQKLDNLIILHQRKLEKLQDIKKAYLNEMFI